MINNYRLADILYLITCFSCLSGGSLQAQPVETIDRLRNKAEMLYAKGDYTQALTAYLDGYRLARQLDPVRAANLTVDISSIYHMQGDYRRGATICQTGVALLKGAATQPDSVWFKLNSSLGEMYKKLNSQDSCYLYFSRANTILQKHPELESRISDYVIYHYNNQGMMYVRDGGYTEGLSYLTKALSIAEKHAASKEDVAILQNNLGEIYEWIGIFDKALTLRKSAIKFYKDDNLAKYYIYNGIAWNSLRSHNYIEARRFAEKALKIYQLIEKKGVAKQQVSLKMISLCYLGDSYCLMKHTEKADYYYNLVIAQSTKKFNREYFLSILGKSHTQQLRNNLPEALVYCQQAIEASRYASLSTGEVIWEQGLFDAQVLKANLLTQQFQQEKKIKYNEMALAAYQEALLVADAMRKRYNALETKWFFSTQVRSAYLGAFETAYTLYGHTRKAADKERAFSLLERLKATALADVTRELLIKPANVPAALLDKERTLQRTITAQKLEPTPTPSPTLIDAQIELAQLQQRFEKEYPAYYRAKYQPQIVRPAEVQAALDPNVAYLSYLLTQQALYIAVVTPNGLTLVRKSGNMGALTAALKTLDTAIYTNPGLGNYTGTPAAIMAYRWLIEPVAHLLTNTERLVISRDGALHRLPFEVLETGRVIDDFLIKHYALSYVPSAGTLLPLTDSLTASPKNNLLSLAPFVGPVSSRTPPLALPYLPASQAEVEQLPGEALLGKAATKARFMRSYASHDLLHFATHAYANNAEPARSYIAFYPDGNPDKLYAGEIYNLSLSHTRLVVLGACETGSGKLQAGEGVMSLAQAFAYAGCPAVVSTLWTANDESTAYLAKQVYEHLQAGLPIDVALQRTRLDYFRSAVYPKLNHPHYWANLILIGRSQPVYDVPWPVTGVVSAVVALMLGVGGALFWQQRRWRPGVALRYQAGNQ